jgi:hypothetical protein
VEIGKNGHGILIFLFFEKLIFPTMSKNAKIDLKKTRNSRG